MRSNLHASDASVFAVKLEAARKGCPEALGELLQSCHGYIRTIAKQRVPRRLQSRIRHSSLAQETFMRACRHFSQFRGQSERQLLIWLKQILLHCLLNMLRQGEFRVNIAHLSQGLAARQETPLEQMVAHERAVALERALDGLPPHYRLAIELRHFRGLTFAEIGKILGSTAAAARKVWARAHVKIGKEMRAFYEPE